MKTIFLISFLIFCLSSGSFIFAQTNSREYSLDPVFTALQFHRPVFLTAFPSTDNKLVIVEQSGIVKLLDNDPQTKSFEVLIDISNKVSRRGNEEGLLGLAFDPKFASNGNFFLYYSASSSRRSVISRFTLPNNAKRASGNSEKIILEIPQPYSNHNGGMLAFGPDGYLYIGLGDGGAGGDPLNSGQDRTTLLGAILRIDPNHGKIYSIPLDNPFVGLGKEKSGYPGANKPIREEIWAYGLRNPWRFSFDRKTGALWVGDVGQNKIEEIDIIEKGGNYGWRIFEGTSTYSRSSKKMASAAIPPFFEYSPAQGYSITGGYVYRGSSIPELQGTYIYGDFSGTIWALRNSGKRVISNNIIGRLSAISSFGEDQNGEVYVISLEGRISRFTSSDF